MSTEQPRFIGHYEILGEIGRGGMAKVYKGVQTSLNRIVAIKVFPSKMLQDEEMVERFQREAQAVAMMNHPNVVQIIDKDEDEDVLYFVMEYVEGTSLEKVLRQRRLSLQEAFNVFREACKGVDYAHRKNIIHRDINPRNVLVSEDLSVVKIADFGISRVDEISRSQGTLSTVATSMGTLHYMAPEQAADMVTADHRSDIYSLGVLLYEMLTGQVPVGRFNLPSRLNSDVPPQVDPVVLKCLATNPKDRYDTVALLLDDVRRLEEKLRLKLVKELRGISRSTSDILRKGTKSFSDRKPVFLGAGAAVVLLIAAAVLWQMLSGGGATHETVELADPPPVQAETDDPPAQVVEPPATPEPEEREDPPPTPERRPQPATTPPPTTPKPVPAKPDPSAELARELQVAATKYSRGLKDQALSDIDEISDRYKGQGGLIDAYFLKAQIFADGGQNDEALAVHVEIESLFPRNPRTAESLYKSAGIVLKTRMRDRERVAIQSYDTLVRRYPKSPLAPQSLARKARLEQRRKIKVESPEFGGKKVPVALLTYRTVVQDYPDAKENEEALWHLGDMYEDLKAYQLAVDAYSALGEKFPNTRHDAWWKAGEVLERRLKDKPRARAAYEKVPPQSRKYRDARKKVEKLGR